MRVEDLSSYEIIERGRIEDIDSVTYLCRHKKTGARVALVSNDDENKVFYISFRTTPKDSTGVAHILEHSVLCGSREFPVKDPFIELCKGSLNTFLNAMTYPDHTVYPVASCNDKDFQNLMHVYLDAVFYPNIYGNEAIFRQEGWHYELDDPEGELTCNGVVYNEMKGMYASPDTLIDSLLNRMLFPDNCYRFQSGGDPEHITELSYEEYVANYRKFYHPSNACVILDGDMDIAAVLTKIGKVFHEFEAQEMDCEINLQEPVHLEECHCPYEVGGNEEIDNKVILAGGWVYGKYDEPEKNMACGVLADLLCSSNESPLRKAILEKGLAENVELEKMEGIQQPYFVLVVRNTSEDKRVEVWETVESALKELAEKGLDHNRLESILSRLEFNLREKESGMYPEGIVNAMRMLDSCLYGGPGAEPVLRRNL